MHELWPSRLTSSPKSVCASLAKTSLDFMWQCFFCHRVKQFEGRVLQTKIFIIFGRANLWTGVSKGTFDAEADLEVCSALARQKPRQICETQNFQFKTFPSKTFLASKNDSLGIV